MGVYIKHIKKPKRCIEEWDFGLMGNACLFLETDMSCLLQPESEPFDCGENYESCPLIEIDLVKCEECEWSNGECSVGERYQGGCTFGERRADEHTD